MERTTSEEGREAYKLGKTKLDNPYDKYTIAWAAWQSGWEDAWWKTYYEINQ